MGISVAASLKNMGHQVLWVSEKRSAATRERAEKHGLEEAKTLASLCQKCDIIVSVCPPHAAEAVAQEVTEGGFSGLYLDANAVSPARAGRIREIVRAGARFVDGGIIGGPAWEPGKTWLHLSGPDAAEVAALFAAGPLETHIVSERVGDASALKMCYAAYTKGTTALLCAILAVANEHGVLDALETQWEHHDPGFAAKTRERARRVTAKAWRFEGEMHEISATLGGAGLPEGFHRAAAELYERLAHFKDAPDVPALGEVMRALVPTKSE